MVVADGHRSGLILRKDFSFDGEIPDGIDQGFEADSVTAAEAGEQPR